MRYPILLAVLAALLIPAAADGGDEIINRPLRILPAPARPSQGVAPGLPWTGRPDDLELRDFPRVLRDPTLAREPDGVLWRRLKAERPDLDPLAVLTQPPAALSTWLADARAETQPDTIHICVLRVDFLQNSAGSSCTGDGRFDLRAPDSAQVPVDPPPHNRSYFDSHCEALRRYYHRQSGETLVLTWDIFPAEEDSVYHLEDTGNYGPWWMSGFDIDVLRLADNFVRDTFAAAEGTDAPPDFRQYESFVIIHAGADFQGDIARNSPYDIPSFNLFLAEPVAVQDSTFFIDLIQVMPEQVSQDGFLGALNGVMTHEYAHQLGFYDLYDVFTFIPQVGVFALQDSGDQLYGQVWDQYREEPVWVRGAIPASCDPWQKLLFFPKGVNATWVRSDSARVSLPSVQPDNDLLLVPIGGQHGIAGDLDASHLIASEYYILENRQWDLNGDQLVYLEADSATGVILGPRNIPEDVTDSLGVAPDVLGQYEFDYLLPGGGVLIWHIDNVAISAAFSVCYGCVNIFHDRRGVDVEEADGIEDLGDIYSVEWTGGKFDYWFQGGYTHFGPDTKPNTSSAGGGTTGITIDVLDSAQVVMDVAIAQTRTRSGWPVFTGYPLEPGGIVTEHLDRDGYPEIVTVAERFVQLFDGDGTGGVVGVSDSLLLPGAAVAVGFVTGSGQPEDVICVASESRVHAWNLQGEELLRYPGGNSTMPDLHFTTPPMAFDSVLVVGDSDGRVRGLVPGAVPDMVWRTDRPGFPVTALAGGEVRAQKSLSLVWGDAAGQVFHATGTERGGFDLRPGWPQPVGSRSEPVTAILLVQNPAEYESGLVLAVDAAGTVALWSAGGALEEGWPVHLGESPAGPPVVGDPDGDGVLEVVLTTRDGQVHMLDLHGHPEAHWPRSVWHPDEWFLGPIRSGPALADLTGDGRPEILQGSADGTLHAFDANAKEIVGWPALVGYAVTSGPTVAQLGEQGGLQIVVGDYEGFVTILRTSAQADSMSPGEMWAGTDPRRQHLYPRELVPETQTLSALLDEDSVLFTPNPVEGSEGWLRVRMGRSGQLTVRLFDTSGRQVWEQKFAPEAGPQGDVLRLDLSQLAPGLYVSRIMAEEGGERVDLVRKLAIVR